MSKKMYYEKNDWILDHELNLDYEDIVAMSFSEFREWLEVLKKTIVTKWDKEDIPPRQGGLYKADLIESWNKLALYDVTTCTREDDEDGATLLRNNGFASSVSQFFPTMHKTKITSGKLENARSVYDMLAEPKYAESTYKVFLRCLKRDSYFTFAQVVRDDVTAVDYVTNFNKEGYDFYIFEANKADETWKDVLISTTDIKRLKFTKRQLGNIDEKNLNTEKYYKLREYKLGQKIFPACGSIFNLSLGQYAVNFPPSIAKYLYETFTNDLYEQDQIIIYDPSAGWGGRILGAMAVNDNRNIHYIGTDPNPDNFGRYEAVADFFNENTIRGNCLVPHAHTYDIFHSGSEVIDKDKDFQKYKGKLDLIFTSPPYFAKEVYSQDKNQSAIKFTGYEAWREGYLRETLRICAEYLRNDRYLLWNIADIDIGSKTYPVEQDSINILKEYGLKHVDTIKMMLTLRQGRIYDDNGKLVSKNVCKINGEYNKYEPVFVFKKG